MIAFLPYIIFPLYGLSDMSSQNVSITLNFDKDDAYDYLSDQVHLGNRIPGTQEREDCANYFKTEFQNIGSGFSEFSHRYSILGVDCENILFKMNEQYDDIVILGAHYDSRAKATKDGVSPSSPCPGANDGASGCAVLTELADIFYAARDKLEVQLWFLFFDAEDQGNDGYGYGITDWEFCEGSEKFVDDIDDYYNSDTESINCMILLDLVGGTNLKFINEINSRSSLLDELFILGRSLGFSSAFPTNPISQAIYDDHVPFNSLGIPTADLIIEFWGAPESWPYHHTTQDDLSHISRESLEMTGKTIEQFIFNNYYSLETYRINYPWDEDYDPLSIEMIIFFISLAGIIVVTILLIIQTKRKAQKKLREVE